jgi:hypothetical protein
MGGYIRVDKDQVADQRLYDIADGIASDWTISEGTNDLSNNDLRHALRNALLGVTVTLWAYADTHIHSDDSLHVTLDGLAAIVGAPVTWLQALPEGWLRVREDGNVELPGYCAKNHIKARDLRREARNGRAEDEREKARIRQQKHRANLRLSVTPVTSRKKARDSNGVTPYTGPGPGPLDQTRDPTGLAASPSPVATGSAGSPEPEPDPSEPLSDAALRAQARILRQLRWPDARILEKFGRHGMTPAHLAEQPQSPPAQPGAIPPNGHARASPPPADPAEAARWPPLVKRGRLAGFRPAGDDETPAAYEAALRTHEQYHPRASP